MERAAPRNPTEAVITCRPYTSCGSMRATDGVMRNYSSQGSYVETVHRFKSGTILILRMVRYPSIPSTIACEARPPSICLAEVKWQQELVDEKTTRYGMGLRKLD